VEKVVCRFFFLNRTKKRETHSPFVSWFDAPQRRKLKSSAAWQRKKRGLATMREKKDRNRAVVCPSKKEVCTFVFSFVFSVGGKSLLYDSEILVYWDVGFEFFFSSLFFYSIFS